MVSRIDYATLGAQRALSSCFSTIARSSAKNPFAEDLVTEHLLGLSVRGSTLFHSTQEVVSLSMVLSMLGAEDLRSSSPTHGLNLQGRRLACVHPHESEQRWQRATAAAAPLPGTGRPQVVLAAANVPEFGELPVQCETHIHNAVSIAVCKSVCFGRNAQSLKQLTCCLHLGAVVVAVQVKDPN